MNNEKGLSQTLLVGGVAAVVVIGLVVWALTAGPKPAENTMMQDNDSMMKDDDKMMQTDDSMMEDKSMTDDKMMESDTMMQKSGSYKDYSTATVESEQAAGNKVVLFFHATWCPFCKAANIAFLEHASEIPAGVTVLKTDYDSNIELRQKYGVTYQHTFVQIDSDENMITKWNGGDVDNVKKYVK